jgi:hypothetical protein
MVIVIEIAIAIVIAIAIAIASVVAISMGRHDDDVIHLASASKRCCSHAHNDE